MEVVVVRILNKMKMYSILGSVQHFGHSVIGWPERTADLEGIITDVLVTGFDIIFFWVAYDSHGIQFMGEDHSKSVHTSTCERQTW